MYTTKAFIVPHLHLIMAGTGVAGFLSRWFVRLNDNFIVRGIDRVNDFCAHNSSRPLAGVQRRALHQG